MHLGRSGTKRQGLCEREEIKEEKGEEGIETTKENKKRARSVVPRPARTTSTSTALAATTSVAAGLLRRSPRPPPTPSPAPATTKTKTKEAPPDLPPFLLNDRLGSRPLRCIFTGTNPSHEAWQAGHAYAHGSNRFWPLVHASPGIVPREVSLLMPRPSSSAASSLASTSLSALKARANSVSSPFDGGPTDDVLLPLHAGIGICDVGGLHPETDLSSIRSSQFEEWAPCYFNRLVAQVEKSAVSVGCRCCCSPSSPPSTSEQHPSTCCAPTVIAFTGKRQFVELLNASQPSPQDSSASSSSSSSPPSPPPSSKVNNKKKQRFDASMISYGPQPPTLRPRDWPACLAQTELWVLTTTSGAAGLTNEARAAPYLALGRRLENVPWPRPVPECCRRRCGVEKE